MGKIKNAHLLIFSAIIDPLLLILALLSSREIVFTSVIPDLNYLVYPFVGLSLIWLFICLVFDLYDNSKNIYTHTVISKNTFGLMLFFLASAGFIFLITDYKFSRSFLIYSLLIHGVLILIWRATLFYIEKSIRKSGKYAGLVVVVGYNENIKIMVNAVYNNPLFGHKLKAIFTNRLIEHEVDKTYFKGGLADIKDYLNNNKIDQLLISLSAKHNDLTNDLLKIADNNLIRVHIIPEFSNYLSQRFAIDYYGINPVLKLRDEPLKTLRNRLIKRAMDVVLSVLTICFSFSWLFPIIILAVKLSSKGPVFFIQKRTGRDAKQFDCYKFRSMRVNSDSDLKQASKVDDRVTRVGAFLRKTSLDETPQIFNILQNHMSLVGPRPHMLRHTEEYKVLVDKFMVRHFAKPGLTGWAQINGFRGETKEIIDMENRAEADIWYIENWSFFLDLKIISATINLLLFKKDENAY